MRPLKRLIWNDLSTKINLKPEYVNDNTRNWSKQKYQTFWSDGAYGTICKEYDISYNEDKAFCYELQFDPRKMSEYEIFDKNNEHHLLNINKVPANILDRVRNKKGFFVISYITEGHTYPEVLKKIVEYFTHYNVPLKKIIYITNSANGGSMIKKYIKRGEDRFHHIYYPCLFEDWGYVLKDNLYKYFPKKEIIKKDFLCFNHNHHTHRLYFYELMFRRGLVYNSYWSMPAEGYRGKYIDALFDDDDTNAFRKRFGIQRDSVGASEKALPLKLDKFNLYKQGPLSGNEHVYFASSMISLVTETQFFREPIHITEKTYKPISFKHPFILIASYGSLRHLKNFGFKTFDKWWDESYDDIRDPSNRMAKLLDICTEISKWSPGDKKVFLTEVQPIVEHNRNVLETNVTRKNVIDRKLINYKGLR